jgi:hypothetical protein
MKGKELDIYSRKFCVGGVECLLQPIEEEKMDLKKFSTFIIILGVLVLGYGGITLATNQPKTFNKAESKPGLFGGRDDFGNALNVMSENLGRGHNREKARKIMIAGGIILFVGFAISASSKKKEVSA